MMTTRTGRADGIGRRAVRWSAVAVLLVGIAAAIVVAVQPDAVPVDVALAARGPMQVTVDEEGRTRIRERYVVSSPLQGRTARITLDPGDRVVAGETVLVTIDPRAPALLDARARAGAEARVRAARAALERAGAELERARSAYAYAENELARTREMAGGGAAMPREIDVAETLERDAREAFRAARFTEEIARFELQQAEAALAYAAEAGAGAAGHGDADADAVPPAGDADRFLIRSPISGVVLRVLQESAAVVEPGAALLEIGDPSDLEVVVDVLSADAVRVQAGAEVAIEAWGGNRPLAAVVRTIEPSAFTETSALGIEEQRVNIVADFVSPPADRPALGDGFRVEARILTWRADDVLQVPTGAVFRPVGGGGTDVWSVYVVEGRVARRRDVGLGHRTWRTAEITGGLEPGARVIVHPSDRLADGVRVTVRGAD